jgi:hypothetical protein
MVKLFKNNFAFPIWIVLFIALFACSKNKEERTQLTEAERIIFDSIYNEKIIASKALIDTMCKQQREDLFQRAVDSIYEIRISEIENMLDNEE